LRFKNSKRCVQFPSCCVARHPHARLLCPAWYLWVACPLRAPSPSMIRTYGPVSPQINKPRNRKDGILSAGARAACSAATTGTDCARYCGHPAPCRRTASAMRGPVSFVRLDVSWPAPPSRDECISSFPIAATRNFDSPFHAVADERVSRLLSWYNAVPAERLSIALRPRAHTAISHPQTTIVRDPSVC
jgi:hypothetical protein